jgi:hypothetical protein
MAHMSYQRTTYVPRRTNHGLHLLLSLFTCGAWLPVWAIVFIYNKVVPERHVTRGYYQ